MKYFYFIFLFIANGVLHSQSDSVLNLYLYPQPDSISFKFFRFCGAEKNPFLSDSLIYFDNADSVKNFVKRKNARGPFQFDNMNFTDTALILVAYHGVDCHSRFDINLIDDIEFREYKFTVKVIYGGCRAGGRYYIWWAKIPKLPEGYKITYHWYYDED